LLKDGIPDIFNITTPGQEISKKKLAEYKIDDFTVNSDQCRIMLLNKIYCVDSSHLEVRKAAVEFLCGLAQVLHESGTIQPHESDLGNAIQKVKSITNEIDNIARVDVNIDIKGINSKKNIPWNECSYVDEHIFVESNFFINKDYENELKDIKKSIDRIKGVDDEYPGWVIMGGFGIALTIVFWIIFRNFSVGLLFGFGIASILLVLVVISGQKSLQDLKVESEKSLNKKKFREHGLEKIRSLLETRKKIHESLN
jgi:hypothetical protein